MWIAWDLLTINKLLIFKLFEILQPFFPKDRYVLFDNLDCKNAECYEVYPFFKFLIKNKVKCNYFLKNNNISFDKIYAETKFKNITVVKNNRNLFTNIFSFWQLLHAHTVITSNGLGIYLNIVFKQNKYINYVFLEHGVTYFKTVAQKYYDSNQFDYFVILSNEEKDILCNKAGYSDKQLICTGLPRLDYLHKKGHNKIISIMFTYHPLENQKHIDNVFDFVLDKKFLDLLENNNLKLKLFIHPSDSYFFLHQKYYEKKIKCLNNIEWITNDNISKYIGLSDIFITDFSSLAFSFMYLNTPVIFYRNNIDETASEKTIYNTFYSKEEIYKKLEFYISNNFVLEDEYKDFNNKFFDIIERGKCSINLFNKLELIRKEKYEK